MALQPTDLLAITRPSGTGAGTYQLPTAALAELVAQLLPPQLLLETAVRSGNTTLALGDAGRVVPVATSSSGVTVTVPAEASVAFAIGTVVNVYNAGSAAITVAGASDVTVRNGGLVAPLQEVSLRKRAANEWVLAGSTT
jgi:hypothetical protein